MDAPGWTAVVISVINGCHIVFRLRFPHDSEKELKRYFGNRFDAIAKEIKAVMTDVKKQDKQYAEFYKEFTKLRIKLAKELGINGD